MIPIDKNVPVPDGTLRKKKYPFDSMAVGDSFFAAGLYTSAQMSSSIQQYQKKTGAKYVAKAVTENGVNGVRVWRVS